jgi:hypothetical protein
MNSLLHSIRTIQKYIHGKLGLGSGEYFAGRNKFLVLSNRELGKWQLSYEREIQGLLLLIELVMVMSEKDSEVPLGVVVNDKDPLPPASKCYGKVESSSALPDASLSINYCDDDGHRWFLLVSLQWYKEDLPRSKDLSPLCLSFETTHSLCVKYI